MDVALLPFIYSLWTAIQALFHTPRLALEDCTKTMPHQSAPWVLIYSGATSVGQFAIQLAHISGYRVIATASPNNFEMLKLLGADVVINYRDPDVSEQIRHVTGDELGLGLDTVSIGGAVETAIKSFGKNGGKLVILKPVTEGLNELRPDVHIERKSTVNSFQVR
jgi:NADPH:quinone reductase-like Zn-dependent oxidoreductase